MQPVPTRQHHSGAGMAPKIEIVIIGGSFAGILSAHEILKTIPTAKVTLINASNSFFFNIAAPRIVAKPTAIRPEDYLLEIESLFDKYSSDAFRFVEGRAMSIDTAAQAVEVSSGDLISYEYLVIASGSTTFSTLEQKSDPAAWKAPEDGKIQDLMEKSQGRIADAKSIVIGGAGPVGIEFAGELAETTTGAGEQRTITLVSKTDHLLPALRGAVGARAEKILKSQGVNVVKGSGVVDAVRNRETKRWTITFENGHQEVADAYISATGVLPNNSFIPSEFVSRDGWVAVDEHLRVKSSSVSALESKSQSNRLPIFAIGDITIHTPRTVRSIKQQIPVLVANLKADIDASDLPTRPTFSPSPMDGLIPIGSSTGTGLIFGIVPWGSIVWLLKGRNYLVPWVRRFLSGT